MTDAMGSNRPPLGRRTSTNRRGDATMNTVLGGQQFNHVVADPMATISSSLSRSMSPSDHRGGGGPSQGLVARDRSHRISNVSLSSNTKMGGWQNNNRPHATGTSSSHDGTSSCAMLPSDHRSGGGLQQKPIVRDRDPSPRLEDSEVGRLLVAELRRQKLHAPTATTTTPALVQTSSRRAPPLDPPAEGDCIKAHLRHPYLQPQEWWYEKGQHAARDLIAACDVTSAALPPDPSLLTGSIEKHFSGIDDPVDYQVMKPPGSASQVRAVAYSFTAHYLTNEVNNYLQTHRHPDILRVETIMEMASIIMEEAIQAQKMDPSLQYAPATVHEATRRMNTTLERISLLRPRHPETSLSMYRMRCSSAATTIQLWFHHLQSCWRTKETDAANLLQQWYRRAVATRKIRQSLARRQALRKLCQQASAHATNRQEAASTIQSWFLRTIDIRKMQQLPTRRQNRRALCRKASAHATNRWHAINTIQRWFLRHHRLPPKGKGNLDLNLGETSPSATPSTAVTPTKSPTDHPSPLSSSLPPTLTSSFSQLKPTITPTSSPSHLLSMVTTHPFRDRGIPLPPQKRRRRRRHCRRHRPARNSSSSNPSPSKHGIPVVPPSPSPQRQQPSLPAVRAFSSTYTSSPATPPSKRKRRRYHHRSRLYNQSLPRTSRATRLRFYKKPPSLSDLLLMRLLRIDRTTRSTMPSSPYIPLGYTSFGIDSHPTLQ
mmetsp:Transcript_2300/g.4947  ORF Transcript_2300/g.4947 Transcript_2300/m.4947 type:complete len:714 (+) Transcript_2300:1227-3368(+)